MALGIRSIGIGHGGTGVAQTPFRSKSGSTGQPSIAAHHHLQSGTRNEIVIKIGIVSDKIPIMTVIVIEFAAEVERAIGYGIIEETESRFSLPFPSQIERNVFIERVGGSGTVTHRI